MLVELFFFFLMCFHHNDQKVYATLLNCWKFLRALVVPSREAIAFIFSMASCFLEIENKRIRSTINKDVTMDNQQPSLLRPLFSFSGMPFTD